MSQDQIFFIFLYFAHIGNLFFQNKDWILSVDNHELTFRHHKQIVLSSQKYLYCMKGHVYLIELLSQVKIKNRDRTIYFQSEKMLLLWWYLKVHQVWRNCEFSYSYDFMDHGLLIEKYFPSTDILLRYEKNWCLLAILLNNLYFITLFSKLEGRENF